MKPLDQSKYRLKIIQDLGKTTADNSISGATARYAICECERCNKPFKMRMGSTAAKKQESCVECTKSLRGTHKHPLYAIWNGIKQRCYSPKRKDYHKYGGIGVTMCEEWKNDVEKFYDWCINNGWNRNLVVDKDIKCRELNISPTIYSPQTISFITTQKNAEEANAKKVLQFTLDGEFIKEFDSTVKAGIYCGATGKKPGTSIAQCCRGEGKTAYGYKWMYK